MTSAAFTTFLAYESAVNSRITGLIQQTSMLRSQWDRRTDTGHPRFERAARATFRHGRGGGWGGLSTCYSPRRLHWRG